MLINLLFFGYFNTLGNFLTSFGYFLLFIPKSIYSNKSILYSFVGNTLINFDNIVSTPPPAVNVHPINKIFFLSWGFFFPNSSFITLPLYTIIPITTDKYRLVTASNNTCPPKIKCTVPIKKDNPIKTSIKFLFITIFLHTLYVEYINIPTIIIVIIIPE